jgi:hypothetical protein
MGRIILGDRDLAALRGIVTFRDFTDPGPVLPWELLEHVRTLIGCDEVELDRTRPSEQKLGEEQSIGDARHFDLLDQANPHYWQLYWASEACSWVDRAGNAWDVTKVSDCGRAAPCTAPTDMARAASVRSACACPTCRIAP